MVGIWLLGRFGVISATVEGDILLLFSFSGYTGDVLKREGYFSTYSNPVGVEFWVPGEKNNSGVLGAKVVVFIEII